MKISLTIIVAVIIIACCGTLFYVQPLYIEPCLALALRPKSILLEYVTLPLASCTLTPTKVERIYGIWNISGGRGNFFVSDSESKLFSPSTPYYLAIDPVARKLIIDQLGIKETEMREFRIKMELDGRAAYNWKSDDRKPVVLVDRIIHFVLITK